jgi:polyisoprenoid-binding protein YceI
MKGIRAACLALAVSVLLGQPVLHEFRPRPEGRLSLTVEKTGLWSGRKHVFEFRNYSAKARINREAPAESSVELVIEVASATCNDAWLSEKDRKKVLEYMQQDMLDAARFPRIVFRSERVLAAPGGGFEIAGRLSVRGMEKPVTVTATLEERNGTLLAVNGSAIVRIKDYGLTPPKAALGAIGTKNEMTVNFRLVPADASD